VNSIRCNLKLKGETVLLVEGEGKITVKSGRVEIFGGIFQGDFEINLQPYKLIPIRILEKAELKLNVKSYKLINQNTIPNEWLKLANYIEENDKRIVMVVGGVDVGKTSLITYLGNRLLQHGLKVAIIDADVGQNEIGPPASIALGIPLQPMPSLNSAKFIDAKFIGLTSPIKRSNLVIEGLTALINRAENLNFQHFLINTTGWIENGGLKFKMEKISSIKPDLIVALKFKDELAELLEWAEGKFEVAEVPCPPIIRRRRRIERKRIREYNYRRWFKGAKLTEIPWSSLNSITPNLFMGIPLKEGETKCLEESLKSKVVYAVRRSGEITAFTYKNPLIEKAEWKLKENLKAESIKVYRLNIFTYLLVGFHNVEGSFKGLGIIVNVDFKNRLFQTYTNVNFPGETLSMILGELKINPLNFKELGWINLQ